MFCGEAGFGQVDNPFVAAVNTCMQLTGNWGPGAGWGAGAGAVLEGVGAMGVAGTVDCPEARVELLGILDGTF